ncbi:MAG: transketolase [Planctomycetes bacterium]|nr:transketolase [Planctomycetota bacterium]
MRTILTDSEVRANLAHLQKTADLVDQLIDLTLNFRQSGHPGGSRSKVYLFTSLLLSGAMRFDLAHPDKAFGDRFVLGAGHCTPLLYSALALMNEFWLAAGAKTKEPRFSLSSDPHRVLRADDLLTFRRNKGLPGHAEMEGKTLFVKANTGPSGHGVPAAAGQALALMHSGARDVNVFCLEGEGGLSAGAVHETKNSAYGLGLENFVMLVDWNNYGIDDPCHDSVVHGTPETWFAPYGWRVAGTEHGTDFAALIGAYREIVGAAKKDGRPGMIWAKNTKGRGYGVINNKSHGTAHKPNSETFWATKAEFQDKYGVKFEGFGKPAPEEKGAFQAQTKANLDLVLDVMKKDDALVKFVAGQLAKNADAVPTNQNTSHRWTCVVDPAKDARVLDVTKYPQDLFVAPGKSAPNRTGLSAWGAYVNTIANEVAGRPLFVVCAADLAESTNIASFMKGHGTFKGFGWYERSKSPEGALLPQQITEFTNSAIMCGMASVNFAEHPEKEFVGYFGACSTYGSFSYLKYGPMRLFSQLAQDSQLKVGKVLWIAGHSGPETAEDSRTHFGIYAPGVTDLFPRGHVVDLHPFDHNEVPVLLCAAMNAPPAIIALHLTRPNVETPDRKALGSADYHDAAKGAYVMKDWDDSKGKRAGTVIFRGTSPIKAAFELLKDHRDELPNVRFVAAPSRYLFEHQPQSYRDQVLSWNDWQDSMCVTNNARRSMCDWYANKVCEEYTLSPDYDDRWRTGGSVDEILDESHLTWPWVLKGIQKFANEHDARMKRVRG